MKNLWFFTNSNTLEIYTYGLGDRPSWTYRYNRKRDFDRKVKALLADGFEFVENQALT